MRPSTRSRVPLSVLRCVLLVSIGPGLVVTGVGELFLRLSHLQLCLLRVWGFRGLGFRDAQNEFRNPKRVSSRQSLNFESFQQIRQCWIILAIVKQICATSSNDRLRIPSKITSLDKSIASQLISALSQPTRPPYMHPHLISIQVSNNCIWVTTINA